MNTNNNIITVNQAILNLNMKDYFNKFEKNSSQIFSLMNFKNEETNKCKKNNN